MCAWNGVPSAAPSTENSKTAKSPARGGRAEERSRWCWKGTGHNDLAKHPIEEMEFDFLSDVPAGGAISVVKNKPSKNEDNLIHYLKRNEKNNTSRAHIKEVPESKKASLDYKIIKELNNYFALEINLHTGRHHQIRAQLSAIGCPIKGDLKYGFDRSNPDGGIHLHARKLVFIHPVSKEELILTAQIPDEVIWNAI